MNTYQPYIYLIGWSKHDRWYVGARYCKGAHPNDLWSSYFTSSQYVTAFRYVFGEPDVIKTFPVPDKDAALVREDVVQFYMDAVKSPRYLNRGRGGHKFKRPPWGTPRPGNKNRGPMSDEQRAKCKASHNTPEAIANHRAANSGRVYSDETRKKMSDAKTYMKNPDFVHPNKGRKWTEAERERITVSRLRNGFAEKIADANAQRAKRYELNGEMLSVADLAERLGMSHKMVRQQISAGIPVEQIQPKIRAGQTQHLIEIEGRSLSMSEWSTETGIHIQTLWGRYYRGIRGAALIAAGRAPRSDTGQNRGSS